MLVDNPFWNSHGQTRLQKMDPDAVLDQAAPERAQTAEALLQEADALARLSLIFRMQSNRFVPISRLQPEILLRIFRFLAECYHPSVDHRGPSVDHRDPSFHQRGPGSLGWVYVTHVCRLWRNVLLNDPIIWGRNVGKIPKAFDEFLERSSSQVPLHLYMSDIRSLASWSSWPLQRVHILHCSVLDFAQLDDLHSAIAADPPLHLRELRTHSPLPVVFPTNRSPRLYTTGLRSWKSTRVYVNLVASNLTEVELTSVRVDAAMLLELFMHSPLLDSFVAKDLLLLEPDRHTVPSDAKAYLPRLRHFELAPRQWRTPVNFNRFQAVMRHVVFPDSANISLDYAAQYCDEYCKNISDLDTVLFLMSITSHDTPWEIVISGQCLTFSTIIGASYGSHGKRIIWYQFRNIMDLAYIFRDCTRRHTDAFERIIKMKVTDDDLTYRDPYREEVVYFSDIYRPLHGSVRTLYIFCSFPSGNFPPKGALALNHVAGTHKPFPNLSRLRLGIRENWDNGYPSTQEIICWLEPRRATGTLPSTLRLNRFRVHDENSTVDPQLLALIPDTRIVDRDEPDSDDDEK